MVHVFAFLDPLYSSGVLLALRSGEQASAAKPPRV
jgi:hypothetical protein